MTYAAVIGMEIHAKLATRSGMFCGCANDSSATEPNVNVCPICLGLPGALPALNAEAIRMLVTLAADLGATVDPLTKWDRKHYFYPDLPKGYQISQYDQPLLRGGRIELSATETWPLTRIHLEEDAGTLQHPPSPWTSEGQAHPISLVNFNRSGVPLAELVTEPIVTTIEAAPGLAKRFSETYQFLLQRRGISAADMEKGEMRCEANISIIELRITNYELRGIQVATAEQLTGTKVEVKNLNSFRSVERAVAYELARQVEALEAGEALIMETRGWDETKQRTVSQRAKETSAEYRYFPDPDLPAINPRALFDLDRHAPAPEPFPHQLARQLVADYTLKPQDADRIAADASILALFGELIDLAQGNHAVARTAVSLYLNLDVARSASAAELADVAVLAVAGTLPKHHIRRVVEVVTTTHAAAADVIADENLSAADQSADLQQLVVTTLAEQGDAIAKYRAGKGQVLGWLVGQAMKRAQGKADPATLRALIVKELAA